MHRSRDSLLRSCARHRQPPGRRDGRALDLAAAHDPRIKSRKLARRLQGLPDAQGARISFYPTTRCER